MAPTDVHPLVAALGVAAAIAAGLASAMVIRLHQLPSGVDIRTEGVSAYALGRWGALYRAQVRASGLAAICIAAACLLLGIAHVVAVAVLATYAVSRVAIARYPTDPPGTTELTPAGRMHVLLASISFVGIGVAAPTIGLAAGWGQLAAPLGSTLTTLSMAVPITVVATFAAGAIARGVFGLVERAAYIATLSWLIVAAISLSLVAAA
jgi:hypothetical protein